MDEKAAAVWTIFLFNFREIVRDDVGIGLACDIQNAFFRTSLPYLVVKLQLTKEMP